MPIRLISDGKAGDDIEKAYAVQNGKTAPVSRIYAVQGGKTSLRWTKKGTRENPYRISSWDDLMKIKNDPAGYYILTQDIQDTHSGTVDFSRFPYSPLLPPDIPFTGVLDGCGYQIRKNILGAKITTLKVSSDGYCGIMFCKNEGIITRLRLSLKGIEARNYTGTCDNCQCIGTVAGYNSGTIDQIWGEYTPFLALTANSYFVPSGAMAGRNTGTIKNVRVGPYQINVLPKTGGIVGINEGLLKSSLALTAFYGNVGSGEGAFAAENRESGIIQYCIASEKAVPLVGENKGTIDKWSENFRDEYKGMWSCRGEFNDEPNTWTGFNAANTDWPRPAFKKVIY